MRKKIIVANWKMHKTVEQTIDFLQGFPPQEDFPQQVWIAPPFTALHAASEWIKKHGAKMHVGGQNMHQETQGAFTGEISGVMLKEAGATFCIIGHSERRSLFHETDQRINAKLKKALSVGLTPIFCVGEHDAARKSGEYMQHIELQIASGLLGIEASHSKHLVIAYEPLWAIGTGRAATPQIAQETHRKIRSCIAKRWGGEIADSLHLLYGGSVNEANAQLLLSEPDIDGLLIGGASLDIESFLTILRVKT